jgi:hypothetical protein
VIIHKLLTIGGEPVKLVNDDVRLDLFTPGRAALTVAESDELSGMVTLDVGYDAKKLTRYFSGYIEGKPNRVDAKHQRIFCRELSAVLRMTMPLNLRKASVHDILKAIAKRSFLSFSTAKNGDDTESVAPFFYSIGNGYHCLDAIGDVFQIPQFIWQQQLDGSVFVGSWANSYWADKSFLIPDGYFVNHGVANTAKLPVMDKVRPGFKLQSRGYVTSTKLQGDNMTMTWSDDPWKTR